MKKLISILILFVFPAMIVGQELSSVVESSESEGIFSKNTWNFNLGQSFDYTSYGIKRNENDQGTLSSWDFDLEANYFVADHYAVGARLVYRGDRLKSTSDDIFRGCRSMMFVNGMYGRRLGDKVNFTLKASAGLGVDRYVMKEPGEDNTTSSETVFGADITAGFPLEVANSFYITPNLGYKYRSVADDNISQKQSGMFLGVDLEFYFPCGDFFCDIENEFSSPSPRYQQGTAVIGSKAYGMFKFGSDKEIYDDNGEEFEDKENFTKFRLMGNGYYYVLNNFAVGAGIEWLTNNYTQKDSDYKDKNSGILFMPMVMLNAPTQNAAQNLFLEFGYGFGSQKSKTEYGGDTDEVKEGLSKFAIGIGYNYFITPKTALTPFVQWEQLTEKDKDTDIKTVYRGINAGISWNVFF